MKYGGDANMFVQVSTIILTTAMRRKINVSKRMLLLQEISSQIQTKIWFPITIATEQASKTLKDKAESMDDKSLHYEIKDIDLIAREFKYHQHCYREFTRSIKRKSAGTERSYSQQGDYLKVKEIISCIATFPETCEDLAWSLIKMVPKNYP